MKKIIFSKRMIEYENLTKLNQPFIDELKKTFDNVLKSGWFILGKELEKFEKEFAQYNQTQYCIGVASGLDALILSIEALNLEADSEIIVPSNTYIATILAILKNGLRPVLVEPNIETYNIDPQKIKNAITAKTRAILIVHLYGKPCDMDSIVNICKRENLKLLEDCAQAHGAKYKGKMVGNFGELGAFSFYPTKNLGALGDGGAVLTKNKVFNNNIRMLRNYGSDKKYYNEHIGINSRLDEIQAAFLNVKLKSLNIINSHKRNLAKLYIENLKADFILPTVTEDIYEVYHIFNIRHERRDVLKKYLLNNNIKTDIHYPVPPHRQKALSFLSGEKFPISEEIHKTTLSLPISYFHSVDDIYKVIEVLNKF